MVPKDPVEVKDIKVTEEHRYDFISFSFCSFINLFEKLISNKAIMLFEHVFFNVLEGSVSTQYPTKLMSYAVLLYVLM